jgi:rubrerythrin
LSIDERALKELVTESEDLQFDALRDMKSQVAELQETAFERRKDPVNEEEIRRYNASRRSFLQRLGVTSGGLAGKGLMAGGFGAALAAFVARPAGADTALDIQILQTASGLETLAVATYDAALGLDFIKNGNKVVVAFAETTKKQHDEHGMAFKAQTTALGGQEQSTPHPGGQKIVNDALPGLTDPLKVVQLAEQLETIATQTYLENTAVLEDSVSKQLMATVMGVETQHAAVLRAVAALLEGGAPELIAIPVDPGKLPAAAGSVATPEAIEPSANALPPESGAAGAKEG